MTHFAAVIHGRKYDEHDETVEHELESYPVVFVGYSRREVADALEHSHLRVAITHEPALLEDALVSFVGINWVIAKGHAPDHVRGDASAIPPYWIDWLK